MSGRKKKEKNIASRFQEMAKHLEKSLGLGGKKTSRFIESLSKNLSPLLSNLESTILTTKSLPLTAFKPMMQVYIKQIAKDAGVSWSDIQETVNNGILLLKEWFKPIDLADGMFHLGKVLFFKQSINAEVDQFGMDPEMVEAVRPFFQFLYDDYWRTEVNGIQNIPKRGRCLLVANHSGMLPYDGSMISMACMNEHITHRSVRFLIEDFVYHFPFLGTFMSRIGAVRACQENAVWLLKKGQLVLVFPEGVKGLGKLYEERYKLKRFGRGGFIKLAIKTKTPIVPAAVIGAEEIHPIIWKSSILAKSFNIPYLPVTPTFPWLGPLGLIPLPTRWSIHFGKPISFADYKASDAQNGILVQDLAETVQNKIQRMLDTGLKKRKSVWMG